MPNVLNESHYRDMNKALNRIAADLEVIERAEQGGIDMSQIREAFTSMREALEQRKAAFFPDRP